MLAINRCFACINLYIYYIYMYASQEKRKKVEKNKRRKKTATRTETTFQFKWYSHWPWVALSCIVVFVAFFTVNFGGFSCIVTTIKMHCSRYTLKDYYCMIVNQERKKEKDKGRRKNWMKHEIESIFGILSFLANGIEFDQFSVATETEMGNINRDWHDAGIGFYSHLLSSLDTVRISSRNKEKLKAFS